MAKSTPEQKAARKKAVAEYKAAVRAMKAALTPEPAEEEMTSAHREVIERYEIAAADPDLPFWCLYVPVR